RPASGPRTRLRLGIFGSAPPDVTNDSNDKKSYLLQHCYRHDQPTPSKCPPKHREQTQNRRNDYPEWFARARAFRNDKTVTMRAYIRVVVHGLFAIRTRFLVIRTLIGHLGFIRWAGIVEFFFAFLRIHGEPGSFLCTFLTSTL